MHGARIHPEGPRRHVGVLQGFGMHEEKGAPRISDQHAFTRSARIAAGVDAGAIARAEGGGTAVTVTVGSQALSWGGHRVHVCRDGLPNLAGDGWALSSTTPHPRLAPALRGPGSASFASCRARQYLGRRLPPPRQQVLQRDDGQFVRRLKHYPACPDGRRPLLPRSRLASYLPVEKTCPGLAVGRRRGRWSEAPPVPRRAESVRPPAPAHPRRSPAPPPPGTAPRG